jgi:succinoglycan biosynthesis protein ExoA
VSPTIDRPVVTLVVAMRNEARFIEACLRSIVAQDYPADRLEVLVYDGGSTDDSTAIVARIAAAHPWVSLLPNPRRIQAAAWNLGIGRARGEIVGIVSGHVELAPGYVAAAVAALARTGADMVGGPARAESEGVVGRAVALATSTPFGVGGARFHYATTEEEVDTVFMGLCRTDVYRALLFDEEMVRNQDDELSYRLLDRGGRIILDPAIESRYRNRATLRGLARQYFAYGFWKVRVMQKHPRQIRIRHLVPPAFVAAVIVSLVAAAVAGTPGLVLLGLVLGSYAVANLAASAWAVRRSGIVLLPLVAAVYAVVHVSYGSGLLVGLVRFGLSRPRAAGTAGS